MDIEQSVWTFETFFVMFVILFLLVLSAFFSGSETALTAASKASMHGLEEEGNKRASLVNRLRERKDKMIGALLITGLLLIPAAIARNISSSPRQMVFIAILSGILSVVVGLFASLEINTSSGPSIIVVALMLFIISLVPLEIKGQLQK